MRTSWNIQPVRRRRSDPLSAALVRLGAPVTVPRRWRAHADRHPCRRRSARQNEETRGLISWLLKFTMPRI